MRRRATTELALGRAGCRRIAGLRTRRRALFGWFRSRYGVACVLLFAIVQRAYTCLTLVARLVYPTDRYTHDGWE